MKKLIRIALTCAASGALLAPSAAFATGPEIFVAQGCNSCHAVGPTARFSIERKSPPDEVKAPDLIKIGATLDKKAIASYILQKTEINGEKHKKGFQGTKDELVMLATWLGELK